jgi:phenylalanyl-tRNA synthetase beta chain
MAKADALAALAAAGLAADSLQMSGDPPAWYHPGRAGGLRLGAKLVAWFGEIHPGVLAQLDVKGAAAGFEVFLDAVPLPRARGRARPLLKLSPFQPVERDFAFVVARELPAETLLRTARGVDKKLIAEVRLFDVYEGPGVPEGKKSLAITVVLQPEEATLTEAMLEGFSKRLVAAVEKASGGSLRS